MNTVPELSQFRLFCGYDWPQQTIDKVFGDVVVTIQPILTLSISGAV